MYQKADSEIASFGTGIFVGVVLLAIILMATKLTPPKTPWTFSNDFCRRKSESLTLIAPSVGVAIVLPGEPPHWNPITIIADGWARIFTRIVHEFSAVRIGFGRTITPGNTQVRRKQFWSCWHLKNLTFSKKLIGYWPHWKWLSKLKKKQLHMERRIMLWTPME